MKKSWVFAIVVFAIGYGSVQLWADSDNVRIEKGVQIIEIRTASGQFPAHGRGYFPKNTVAKAGLPTVLRFFTKNTRDCSTTVEIAEIEQEVSLPRTGTTDVVIPVPAKGSKIQGTCVMGMYDLEIDFE